MSCAPSGATPIVSTTPSGGERSCPLPVRGSPSWRESPMESRRGEKSGQRLYSVRPEQGFSIEGPRPCALSLELPGAERSGEGVQTKPQLRLYHSIQPLSGAGCLPRQDGCSYPLRREEPDINTLCPQSTFQELPAMGKEYASLDRSWPPVLGSGERTCSKRAFWTSVVWLSGSVSLDLRRTQPLSPEQWSTAVEPGLFV